MPIVQDGAVLETGTHPELVELGGHYAEMWSRQKETTHMPRSLSTASMSSATTSRAADGDVADGHSRRTSRGLVGSLLGATQAMLGYGHGSNPALTDAAVQSHGQHGGYGHS